MWSFLVLQCLSVLICAASRYNTSWTSSNQIRYHIEWGVHFMCSNQYESNGQFLYQFDLHKNHIEVVDDNNNVRQAGGLYSIGQYYRMLYASEVTNDNEAMAETQNTRLNPNHFSVADCLTNSIRYLQNISESFTNTNLRHLHQLNTGSLIDGNTGATALALLGMIEICVAEQQNRDLLQTHNLCHTYLPQIRSWIAGLLLMRHAKLQTDLYMLRRGAFSQNLEDPASESSAYYDAESYLALSRLLKYQHFLTAYIASSDELWSHIAQTATVLDEYFMQYKHEDDAHWALQAWFDRWVTFNFDAPRNKFMDRYMVAHLMKHKWIELMGDSIDLHDDYVLLKSSCASLEAGVDILHAVHVASDALTNFTEIEHLQQYALHDELREFKQDVWDILRFKFEVLFTKQLFEYEADFYYEAKYDGAFLGDNMDALEQVRVDNTQHCISALMKLYSLFYVNVSADSHSYTFDEQEAVPTKVIIEHVGNYRYDMMVSGAGVVVIILLVNMIFFYWCWYYPKEQRRARLMHELNSDASDIEDMDKAEGQKVHLDEYEDSEDAEENQYVAA
mmetsp:Transcript_45645/g.73042  ORF Transcript_45645/g.73042 Transcript_45645/m.73042 type:complete len:562 (-) Transcript_45645:315-2000(-)